MRTRIVLCAVVFLALLALPAAAANIDLVVMVDTSTSMFPFFDDLIHYLLQDLLKDRLHAGDTFHLLSFDSTPQEELSVDIGNSRDVEKAFGRILLLQPLGRYTDLIAALQFLYRYVRELPETNPKTILLLTDGVHDPPPGSPNRGDPEKIRAAVTDIAAQIQKQGWTIHILKVPPKPVPGEEGLRSYLPDLAQALHTAIIPYKTEEKETISGQTTGFPTLRFPGNLGTIGSRFRLPLAITNYRQEPIIVRLAAVESGGSQLLERKVAVTVPPGKEVRLDAPLALPAGLPKGEQTMRIRLQFEDDLRISPTDGDISFTLAAGGISLPHVNLMYVLYIAGAAVIVFLLVMLFLFMRRKLHEVSAGVPRTALGDGSGAAAARSPLRTEPAAPAGEARGGVPPAAEAGARKPGRGGRRLVPLMGSPFEGASLPAPPALSRPAAPRHTIDSLMRSLPSPAPSESRLPPLIEMRVGGQNSHIGFRNIHRMTAGSSRSVGGRFSGFLVFLVPVPRGIAEIRNESGSYVFRPRRAEFFPSLSGPLNNCLDVEIPLSTPAGFSCSIMFRRWVSPLDEINALMRSARSG